MIYVFVSDLQTWWEIPSIVHFCKFFSLFSKDICPIDITVSTYKKHCNINKTYFN